MTPWSPFCCIPRDYLGVYGDKIANVFHSRYNFVTFSVDRCIFEIVNIILSSEKLTNSIKL